MTNAIDLAQYYLGEAKRLAEAATISADTEKAEALRLRILNSWPAIAASSGRGLQNILPSDAVQFGPGAMREARTVKKLMAVLASHGWLVQLDAGAVVDGKARKTAYRIVREQ